MDIVVAIVIGVIIALIIVSVQKSSLTTVRKDDTASEYVKKETLKLSQKTDKFMYTKLEKTAKPQNK